MSSWPEISFSLTERWVIDPSLSLYAPKRPIPAKKLKNLCPLFDEFINNTIVSRVVAVFASIFALADAAIHLATAICKGTRLLAEKIHNFQACHYTGADVMSHLKQSLRFTGIAMIASVAGIISPSFLQRFEYQPPMPPAIEQQIELHVACASPNYSEAMRQAIQLVTHKPNDLTPLRQFWESATLREKDDLVRLCNTCKGTGSLRSFMENDVYKPILRHIPPPAAFRPIDQISWLTPDEVISRQSTSAGGGSTTPLDQAFYYHSIHTQKDLEVVLNSKEVKVRHARAFKGAFVSTKPEYFLGKYILVFNRSIERLSQLAFGFFNGSINTYWAGFSRNIPVTERTLCCIILDDDAEVKINESDCSAKPEANNTKDLEKHIRELTGRLIPVVRGSELGEKLEKIKALNMGIPKEWPSTSDNSLAIIATI